MDTEGVFAPTTPEEVRERFEGLAITARTLVTEIAGAMDLPQEAYEERVTPEVVATAREALFASLLVVHVGTREEYEDWLGERGGAPLVVEVGSEHVDRVAWHDAPAAGTVVAATFEDEPAAAVETLRRQAFGRCYRELV